MSRLDPAADFEFVLIRHVAATKRGDLDRIEPMLKAPFRHTSSTMVEVGTGSANISRVDSPARGRWVFAAHFQSFDWFAIFTNATTPKELFELHAKNRRLEVAWLKRNSRQGWHLHLYRGGKQKLQYVHSTSVPGLATFQSDELGHEWLGESESGEQTFRRLLDHFGISPPPRTIVVEAGRFRLIGKSGREVKSGLQAYCIKLGPAIGQKSRPARQLARAIDQGDVDAVRRAVAAGASLNHLPDSPLSPLSTALSRCDRPGGRQCVEALIELGCSIDGAPGEAPLILSAVRDYIPESLSLEKLDILLANGADVNASVPGRMGPVLFDAVLSKRLDVIRLLLEHGADPDQLMPAGISIRTWLEQRIEEERRVSHLETYRRIHSLITGEPYRPLRIAPLPEPLQIENRRFQQIREARQIVELLPDAIRLRKIKASRLAGHGAFKAWEQQLREAGFRPAGHFLRYGLDRVRLSAYTHEKLRLDAVLSTDGFLGDDLRCEFEGYATDGKLITVANYQEPELTDEDYLGGLCFREQSVGDSPSKLLAYTKKVLKRDKIKLEPIAPQGFAQRNQKAYRRILDTIRRRADEIVATAPVRIDGRPPRYERVGFYYDFSKWDDPTYSTAKAAKEHRERILDVYHGGPRDRNPFDVEQAIRDACYLVGMQHMQFAGAPTDTEHLGPAIELAREYLETGKYGSLWRGPVRLFEQGLLLTLLAERWDEGQRMCQAVKRTLATRKGRMADDPPVQHAQFLLVLASHFRKRAVSGLATFEKSILTGRPRRPALLLRTWRAVRNRDQVRFASSVVELLKHWQNRPLNPADQDDIRSHLAVPESVIALLARREGLECPNLEPPLDDYLIGCS